VRRRIADALDRFVADLRAEDIRKLSSRQLRPRMGEWRVRFSFDEERRVSSSCVYCRAGAPTIASKVDVLKISRVSPSLLPSLRGEEVLSGEDYRTRFRSPLRIAAPASVAQPDKTSVYETEGHRFESCQARCKWLARAEN
jgi:hypothetical protein